MLNWIISAGAIYLLIGIMVEIVRDTSGGTRKAIIVLIKQALVWPFLFKTKS